VRERCRNDPELCMQILRGLDTVKEGWCELCKLAPSKEKGYIQLSYGGANKFAMLQEVVLWAAGVTKGKGDHCSHLCCKPLCTIVGHVCGEDPKKNNERKGCVVWVDCPHCGLKILVCPHEPKCIKFAPGFSSWEAFLQNGIHK
jgi:hypothetical protein